VVLELGGNDGLRGLPVAEMRKNLAAMIERSQKARAGVVMVGVYIPPNYGPDYTKQFFDTFGALAKRYRTAFVPYIMEDFALKPEYFQADRIHPTAEAQPLMMERVWKALRPLLKP